MTSLRSILAASLIALCVGVAVWAQVPISIVSATAGTCQGPRQVIGGVPWTGLPADQSARISAAILNALTTPGAAPAANPGCLQSLTVTLASGAQVQVTLTADVVAAVTAELGLPASTAPSTGPATSPATLPATQPQTVPDAGPASQPATGPTSGPTTGPTSQPTAATYTVAQSEVLYLVTNTGQPEQWTFRGVSKKGWNAAFAVPLTVPVGTYPITTANEDGSNPIAGTVTVTKDPYTTVDFPPSGNLDGAAGLPDHTRIILSPTVYSIGAQTYLGKSLQIVGQPGTIISLQQSGAPATWKPLFGFYLMGSGANVSITGVAFRGATGGKLNANGETELCAIYALRGTLQVTDCTFAGIDCGVKLDSTPTAQPVGVLISGCTDAGLYAQSYWLGGSQVSVEGCRGGPSVYEHALRSSILSDAANQIPTYVRIDVNFFDGTHKTATSENPQKESVTLRDGRYFYLSGNHFVGWVDGGQGLVNSWDVWRDYVWDSNVISDPSTAPKTATIDCRAGTTGPGRISNNTCAVPIIVSTPNAPTRIGNTPPP